MIFEWISIFLVLTSLVFMVFGVAGIFRFNDFYSRILITSKVDTVGFLTLMAGVIVRSGFSYFSLKVMLLCVIVIITNPLSTHAIARSALISGYMIKREEKA